MEIPGFEITEVDDIHIQHLKKSAALPKEVVRIDPPGFVSTKSFAADLRQILDFKVYPDDTWVITFPKSGTTWTQEMVWLLLNNLDYEKAGAIDLPDRFPFLELPTVLPEMMAPTIETMNKIQRPRCMKSHLPVDLLPRELWTVKPKIIYVSRNPKDVVVSFYYHNRLFFGYTGTFEEFFDAFLADREMFAPYWPNFLGFWEKRHESNVLFNSYEEMKQDLPGVIKKTAAFLNVELTEEQLRKLADHLSFESMRKNNSVNYEGKYRTGENKEGLHFLRSGKTGGWKEHLTSEMSERMDEWIRNEFKNTELDGYPF